MIRLHAPVLTLTAALSALALAGSGCGAMKSSRRLDMAPFADNTITTIGEMDKLNKPAVWIQLRAYRTRPAVQEVGQDMVPVRTLLRQVAFYSAQLVSINDSSLPEQKKAKALARYVREVVKPAVEAGQGAPDADELGVQLPDVDRVCAEMEAQETFLGAIARAEPLINATLHYGLKLFDRVDDDLQAASAEIEREVDAQFGPLSANVAAVYEAQQRTVRAFTLLYQLRAGQPVLAELRAAVPDGATLIPVSWTPTRKDLQGIEDLLAAQMQRLKAARDQLEPDVVALREAKAELDELRTTSLARARAGRVTLILWARSHRNLGMGVAVPPAIDLPGMLFGSVSKAAGKAIPF
jgi:hypothetical protein